jgi:hypothetical protein
MKNIFSFEDFVINEEFNKLPTTYKYTKNEAEDKEHNKLASKEKDGHKWKSSKKKHGKESITQKFACECGYGKEVVNDENKSVTITYTKK